MTKLKFLNYSSLYLLYVIKFCNTYVPLCLTNTSVELESQKVLLLYMLFEENRRKNYTFF